MHIRGVEIFTVTDEGLIAAVDAYWGDEDVTFANDTAAHPLRRGPAAPPPRVPAGLAAAVPGRPTRAVTWVWPA